MELLEGLLADAGLLGAVAGSDPGGTPHEPPGASGRAVARHRAHRTAAYAGMVGPLLVPDDRLAEVGRHAGDDPIAVRVVVGGGAGGLVALSRRTVAGVTVVSAVSALRDLDDPAGNAARVVAAAAELDDSVHVFVELPSAPGWVAAAELVEAAGLAAQVRADRGPHALIEQLALLVEADLPFSVAGTVSAPPADLLHAVGVLVETGDPEQALARLTEHDHSDPTASLTALSATRIRRRLLSVDCPDVAAAAAQLGAAPSGSGPAGQPPGTPLH